jgi:hypothetical protein
MFSRYPITRAVHVNARRITVSASAGNVPRNPGWFADVAEAQASALRLLNNAEGRDPNLADINRVTVRNARGGVVFDATRGSNGRFTVRTFEAPSRS